jgi:putative chitinase
MPFASSKRIDVYLEPLNQVMDLYAINSIHRIAAFLAQLAHESGSLVYVKEIAAGTAYEGRKDLGNIHPGDGQKYKGRGLIQITGRGNYQALTDHFKVDFINNPTLLEQPLYATLSAGWFWDKMNLNALADQVTEDSFKKITKKINGGLNGYDDRVSHWKRCKAALV